MLRFLGSLEPPHPCQRVGHRRSSRRCGVGTCLCKQLHRLQVVDRGSGYVRHTRARLYSRSSKGICFPCLHGIPTLHVDVLNLRGIKKIASFCRLFCIGRLHMYVCVCMRVLAHSHSFLWYTCVFVYDGIYNFMCP